MTQSIHEAIVAEVEKGTFTPEALKRMQQVVDKVKDLEIRLSTVQRQSEVYEGYLRYAREQCTLAAQKLDSFIKRESNLIARESKMSDLERSSAVAVASQSAFERAMAMVFKNTIVRENILDHASGVITPSYPNSSPFLATVPVNKSTITEKE